MRAPESLSTTLPYIQHQAREQSWEAKSSKTGPGHGVPQDFYIFPGDKGAGALLWSLQEDFLKEVGFLALSERQERSSFVDV